MATLLTRRRFIAISAALACAPVARAAAATPLTIWRGVALGAGASIRIAHPEADRLIARAVAEIDRLEDIFSLYRPASALMRLNETGRLTDPPFEMLECLSLCAGVHAVSGGLFDPTVQPLWRLYATAYSAGRAPTDDEIAAARALVGWGRMGFDAGAVRLAPGMALTLNGVAQGYVADRIAALFRADGLTDILVDMGEMRALGGAPGGGGWPVRVAGAGGTLPLRERALATSAPRGTAFDAAGRAGHILDPQSGRPSASPWTGVSVSAPDAALADALSTAACLMRSKPEIDALVSAFSGARLEHVGVAA